MDVVTEDDCVAGGLASYAALYTTEPHVTAAAAAAIAAWVAGGGRLFAAAGAGLLDEKNKTNAPMAALLGVTPEGTYEGRGTDYDGTGASAHGPRPVQYIKQDLPFAPNPHPHNLICIHPASPIHTGPALRAAARHGRGAP